MKRLAIGLAGYLVLCATAARGQLTVEGRAAGTSIQVLDAVDVLTTADTGVQSATAPGTFDREAPEQVLDAAPLAVVVSGSSRTAGLADVATDDNESFVTSIAGDVSARVLPDAAPDGADVLAAVTTETSLTASCESGFTGTASFEVLTIAGTDVTLPGITGTVPPNTTILSPELPLIVLNEQRCSTDASTRSVRCLVNAVHLTTAEPLEATEIQLSHAEGGILNIPEDVECALFDDPFVNSFKRAALQADADQDGFVEVGDTVRFTVHVENSGLDAQPIVRIIDRLPREMTLDAASIRLNGLPVASPTIGPCPGDVAFRLCRGEPSEECLTVDVGDLQPGAGAAGDLTFDMTVDVEAVDPDGEGSTCNTVRIGPAERQAIVDLGEPGFDAPPITPDRLATTGSGGGCSVGRGGESVAAEAATALLLIALAGLARATRKHRDD